MPRDVDRPALVIMTHGLSGIIALDLDEYASWFVNAGFAVLAYDHRNWGGSDGAPRSESDPWQQVADLREAISYARTRGDLDPDRIGLWGTSYAGGHVLTVAALDRRIKCIVSQVPLISGARTFDAWVPADKREKFLRRIELDRDARRRDEAPSTVPAAVPGSETAEWIAAKDVAGAYVNELTLRSFDLIRSYEPENFVSRISPTPVMMIIATADTQTPTAWQREAFEKIQEPKRLVEITGRHYDVYMDKLDEAAKAALSWYHQHL